MKNPIILPLFFILLLSITSYAIMDRQIIAQNNIISGPYCKTDGSNCDFNVTINTTHTGLWDNNSGVATYTGNAEVTENMTIGDTTFSKVLFVQDGGTVPEQTGISLSYSSFIGGILWSFDTVGESFTPIYIEGDTVNLNILSSKGVNVYNLTSGDIVSTGTICDSVGCIGSGGGGNSSFNQSFTDTRYLYLDGSNADTTIDIGTENFNTDGIITAGSTEIAIIGDDGNGKAGYFTDGLSSVYLSGSSGFALDVRDSPSYFEDGATSVYLAYASKSLLSAYHIDISNSYSARIGDDSSQVSGYFSGNGGLVEIADSKHAIDVNRGDVHLESGTSNVIMNNNNLSLEGELILNSSSGHLMTFNNQESGALESGSITWIGGSRLIEQRSGGTGVDRMVYTPNGNRIDILNEAGSAYGSDIYGGDLFHWGDGRGYRSVYGNGKDVEIYFDGADMIINSNDITASDELLFTNFDIYNFDNTLQIDGTIQNSNGESILFTTDTVEFLVNYGNTMNIGSNSVTFAGNNVRFLETGDVVYFSDWNGSDREDFMRADVQADEIDFIQYDILTTGNITAHSLFLNESSLYLGGNKLSASGSELLWNDAPIESTPTGNVSDVYVNITGDTMTGNLTINTSSAKLKILTDGNSGSAQIELKENSGGDLGFNLAYDGSENELTLDSNGASGKRWLRIHRSLSFINLTQDTSIDGKVSTNDRFYLPNGGSIGDNSTCAFIFYDNLNNVIDTMGCS